MKNNCIYGDKKNVKVNVGCCVVIMICYVVKVSVVIFIFIFFGFVFVILYGKLNNFKENMDSFFEIFRLLYSIK